MTISRVYVGIIDNGVYKYFINHQENNKYGSLMYHHCVSSLKNGAVPFVEASMENKILLKDLLFAHGSESAFILVSSKHNQSCKKER